MKKSLMLLPMLLLVSCGGQDMNSSPIVEETAKKTLATIQDIYWAQRAIRQLMKEKTPEIYSKELVELLFEQPYCKIAFLVERGICKKQTASRYLSKLCDAGILHLMKRGRENYYINISLCGILTRE